MRLLWYCGTNDAKAAADEIMNRYSRSGVPRHRNEKLPPIGLIHPQLLFLFITLTLNHLTRPSSIFCLPFSSQFSCFVSDMMLSLPLTIIALLFYDVSASPTPQQNGLSISLRRKVRPRSVEDFGIWAKNHRNGLMSKYGGNHSQKRSTGTNLCVKFISLLSNMPHSSPE